MKRKLKIILVAPLAAGTIIAVDSTRSDAFILKTLEGLWNQTTEIVTGTLDRYVGDYVTDLANLYIPKGLDAIAGALGLPDPGGLFKDIREEAAQNKTENNDIVAGDLEESNVTRSFGKAVGEAHFSTDNQEALKKVSETYGKISKSSVDLAKNCQQKDITQEVQKCTNQLLTNQIQGQNMLHQALQNQNHLLATGTMLTSDMLKRLDQEAIGKQNRNDAAVSAIDNRTQYIVNLQKGLGGQ